MISYLEVDGKLPQEDCGYWQDVLYRCLDEPEAVLAGEPQHDGSDDVDVSFVWDGKTQFYCDVERYLCGGYSEDEYAADFKKAMGILTKDVTLDFKVSLSLYYREHDADLAVEFSRKDLSA
jgi:hypothetical protein